MKNLYPNSFLLISIFVFTALQAQAQYKWLNKEPYKSCMAWSEAQKELYRKADPEVLAIHRLSDPAHDPTPDQHDFFGWPVGLQVGNVTLASGNRSKYHWSWGSKESKGGGDGHTSTYLKRSIDGGKTWSEGMAVDIAEGSEKNDRIGFGHALGYANGKVFLVSSKGVFTSADTGKTWTRIPKALAKPENCESYCKINIGPRVLYHPKAGLLVFAHHRSQPLTDSLIVLNSLDEGKTWNITSVPTHNPDVVPVEPTGFVIEDNRIVVFGRNGPNGITNSPFSLELVVNGPGDYAIKHAVMTKIPRGSTPDTHDIVLNPFNNRFEAVISSRISSDLKMRLTLWSIAKDDLLAGRERWSFEGVLAETTDSYGPSQTGQFESWVPYGDGHDGFHPAASVILPNEKKQLLFVYMAKSTDTYSSTFVIERTLDTERLSNYLLEYHDIE